MLSVNEFLLRQAAKPSGQVNKEICIAYSKVVRSDYYEKTNLLVYSFLVYLSTVSQVGNLRNLN